MFKDTEKIILVENTPTLEILMATMERDNLQFLTYCFPNGLPPAVYLLIINQSKTKKLTSNHPNIRVINSPEKGLAKSRNLALAHAQGKLCVFADDDVVFYPGFKEKIIRAFSLFPNSSLIRFQYEKEKGKPAKNYSKKAIKNLSWLQVLQISSIEMVIKRTAITAHNCQFDIHFGLGSNVFEMGEEQVFAADVKKALLKISYVPEVLVFHAKNTSSAKKDFRERYFIFGGVIKRIFNSSFNYWVWLKIFFDLKQKKLSFKYIIAAYQTAQQGAQYYLKRKDEHPG